MTVLLAILLLLALPSYQQHVLQARRAIAVAELSELAARMDWFFQDHKRYARSFTELGFPADPYAIDAEGQAVGVANTHRIYLMKLSLQGNGFTLSAHPQLAQVADTGCAVLSLTDAGLRSVSGPASEHTCW